MSKTRKVRPKKEAAYDEHISPLMGQIIDLCKKHGINMAATFALDPNEDDGRTLFCTTVMPVDEDDEEGFERVRQCGRVMYPQPEFMAFTISTKPPVVNNPEA